MIRALFREYLPALILMFAAAAAHAAPFVTSAIHWGNGKAQFFLSDGTYLRYDIPANRVDPGYPKPVTDETWPGMGRYGRQITAAFNGSGGKAYFFLSNGEYLRYDIRSDRVDPGYPKPVDDTNFRGLGRHARQLFGALNWGNKVQFFLSNGMYVRYDLTTHQVDPGYPKAISRETWPGLEPYAGRLAGMINWENNKAYMFLDDNSYIRYDIASDRIDPGYPKRISDSNWPGMAQVFNRQRTSQRMP